MRELCQKTRWVVTPPSKARDTLGRSANKIEQQAETGGPREFEPRPSHCEKAESVLPVIVFSTFYRRLRPPPNPSPVPSNRKDLSEISYGTQIVNLLTTLLDPQPYRAEEKARLYARR
jgi:hypothetical protein